VVRGVVLFVQLERLQFRTPLVMMAIAVMGLMVRLAVQMRVLVLNADYPPQVMVAAVAIGCREVH
jgi:hypothetical protein